MKLSHVVIAQVAVLGLTTIALIATSRPPCSTNTPETQVFLVAGDCGPSGVITITSDATCSLVVDGGTAVFLPRGGVQPAVGPMRGQAFKINSYLLAPDGGAVPLTDGGARAFSTLESTGLCVGCPGSMGNYRGCVASSDGGVVSLACGTDDGPASDTCTALLTPIP